MQEKCIHQATFNPKVKQYWTVIWVFVSAITIVGIVLLPFVALLSWLISGKVLQAMSAQLLERKLVVKRGILFFVEKSIPLEKITDVALSQGPVMRYFGLYQLSFETAGQSAHGALVSLVGVNDAANFREAILKQKDKLSGDNSAVIEPTDPSANELSALTQSVQNIEKLLGEIVAKQNR